MIDVRTFGDRLADLCAKIEGEMRDGEIRNTLIWSASGQVFAATVMGRLWRRQDGAVLVRCLPDGIKGARQRDL